MAKTNEPSSSVLAGRESRTHVREEAKVVGAYIATSASKITYWLRKLPNKTLIYLPHYREYRVPDYPNSSASQSVLKQAMEPLSTRDLDELNLGYLHAYWNRASFGVWKISYIGRDVDTRLNE